MTPGPIPKRCGAEPLRPSAAYRLTDPQPASSGRRLRRASALLAEASAPGPADVLWDIRQKTRPPKASAVSFRLRHPPLPHILPSRRPLPASGVRSVLLRPPSAIAPAVLFPPPRSAGVFFVSFPRHPRKSAFYSAFFAGFCEKSPKSRLIFLPAMLYSRKAAPRQRRARRRPAASGGRKGRVTGCFARNTRI